MDALLKLAKMDDIKALREALDDADRQAVKLGLGRVEMTLQNAQLLLGKGLKRKPEAWTITMAELPELWAEIEVMKVAA